MPKVSGPLFSASAHGTIGERLTFSRRASGQQARFQRPQKDRITSARIPQRYKFSQGLTLWRSLSSIEKGYWKTVESQGFVEI
jgi:hypothetical protein